MPRRLRAPRRQAAPDFDRLFARALELHQAGDILGAIDAYKAALAIAPDRADALSNLGAAYVRLGQFDDAIKQYEAALEGRRRSTTPSASTWRWRTTSRRARTTPFRS